MATKTSVPHLDHVECGRKRLPLDMYIELYGTGRLPRKYEQVLEEYFKTTDKREMLRKALRSKVVPVMCPNKTVELVEFETGDMMKKVAKELVGIASDILDEPKTAAMALPLDVIREYRLPRNWWGFFIFSGGKSTRAKWHRIMERVESDPSVKKPWGKALSTFKKSINSQDKERMVNRLYALFAANGMNHLSERLEEMPVNRVYEVMEKVLDVATGGVKGLLSMITRHAEKKGWL